MGVRPDRFLGVEDVPAGCRNERAGSPRSPGRATPTEAERGRHAADSKKGVFHFVESVPATLPVGFRF